MPRLTDLDDELMLLRQMEPTDTRAYTARVRAFDAIPLVEDAQRHGNRVSVEVADVVRRYYESVRSGAVVDLPKTLRDLLAVVEDGLGMDRSAVIGMIVSENIGPYLDRAHKAIAGRRVVAKK